MTLMNKKEQICIKIHQSAASLLLYVRMQHKQKKVVMSKQLTEARKRKVLLSV